MPKYISGRIKLRDPGKLTADRYRYLGLDQAEPNLGDPPDGTPPTAAIPSGERYQIISIEGHPGERYWIPTGGGLIPGSIDRTNFLEILSSPPYQVSRVKTVSLKPVSLPFKRPPLTSETTQSSGPEPID